MSRGPSSPVKAAGQSNHDASFSLCSEVNTFFSSHGYPRTNGRKPRGMIAEKYFTEKYFTEKYFTEKYFTEKYFTEKYFTEKYLTDRGRSRREGASCAVHGQSTELTRGSRASSLARRVPLKPFWLKEEKEPNWGEACVRQARGMSPSPGRRAKHRPEGEEVVGSASSPAKQDLAELAMPSGRPQSGTTAGDLTNIGTFADGDEAVRSVAGQPRCLEHLRRSRRPPREDPNISVRNTARGLRSRAAIAVRRNRRNDKRNCAIKGSRARRGVLPRLRLRSRALV